MTRDLDTIRSGLAEVWGSQGRRFVTFEQIDRAGAPSGPWIQFLDGELNVEWAADEEPALVLARRAVVLPRSARVAWFAAGSNAVISLGDARLDEVAALVDSLLSLLGRDASLAVTARVESHR